MNQERKDLLIKLVRDLRVAKNELLEHVASKNFEDYDDKEFMLATKKIETISMAIPVVVTSKFCTAGQITIRVPNGERVFCWRDKSRVCDKSCVSYIDYEATEEFIDAM